MPHNVSQQRYILSLDTSESLNIHNLSAGKQNNNKQTKARIKFPHYFFFEMPRCQHSLASAPAKEGTPAKRAALWMALAAGTGIKICFYCSFGHQLAGSEGHRSQLWWLFLEHHGVSEKNCHMQFSACHRGEFSIRRKRIRHRFLWEGDQGHMGTAAV